MNLVEAIGISDRNNRRINKQFKSTGSNIHDARNEPTTDPMSFQVFALRTTLYTRIGYMAGTTLVMSTFYDAN